SKFIEQIMVIGESQKMPAALIQLNFEHTRKWCEIKNITGVDTNNKLAENRFVKDRIRKEITFHNQKFGNWEQIKKFELTPNEWTLAGGHLTPTMKVKRKVILELYQDLFTKIYPKN
ncbi:MAG: long-chain fatty acid--CoA ligase, partial [Wenyingzhuangia sp.]